MERYTKLVQILIAMLFFTSACGKKAKFTDSPTDSTLKNEDINKEVGSEQRQCIDDVCVEKTCEGEVCSVKECIGEVCKIQECIGDVCKTIKECVGATCSTKECTGEVCHVNECIDDNCLEKECIGNVCQIIKECKGDVCVAQECEGDVCKVTECIGDICSVKEEPNKQCPSDDCTQEEYEVVETCEGSDCEKPATPQSSETPDAAEQAEDDETCEGDSCKAEEGEKPCEGDACNAEEVEKPCEGDACKAEEGEKPCEGDACKAEEGEKPHEGETCDIEESQKPCEGDACKEVIECKCDACGSLDGDNKEHCDCEACHVDETTPCESGNCPVEEPTCKEGEDCKETKVPPVIVSAPEGIKGGHFDVDTFVSEELWKKQGKRNYHRYKKEHRHHINYTLVGDDTTVEKSKKGKSKGKGKGKDKHKKQGKSKEDSKGKEKAKYKGKSSKKESDLEPHLGLMTHVHEYDKKFMTNGVIFLGASNGSSKADEVMVNGMIPEDKKFGIKLINAEYNTDGVLYVNDSVYNYENLPDSSAEYTVSQIKRLSIVFSLDSLKEGGLHPSTPSAVKKDVQGPNGSRRSGAMTVQLIDSETGEIIVEGSVYWHKKHLKSNK